MIKLSLNQNSRWDSTGTEPASGNALYEAGGQPKDWIDNWFNNSVTTDISNILYKIGSDLDIHANGEFYDIIADDATLISWDDKNSHIELNQTLNALNNDIIDDGTTIWDTSNSYIPQGRLQNDSVSVAGNSVSLGSSTTVDYVDLNDTGTSFPIPNTDLNNSSVTVAGNSVSLGSSTTVSHSDLSDAPNSAHHAKYTDSEAITAINNDTDHSSSASHNYYTDESAQDAVDALLISGNRVSLTYDDTNNDLTIDSSWRSIESTPSSGSTATSISSDWANTHTNTSGAHHGKTATSDVTSANWGDLELQINGTDDSGIINFKT